MTSHGMSRYENPEDEIHWSDEDDHIFDSPIADKIKSENASTVDTKARLGEAQTDTKTRPEESRYDAEEARAAALKQELENVRRINQVIEGVVDSLEKAKGNMDTVSHTVNSASTLLQTWTRILSQTEHNQRLILNPAWQGATQDLAAIEAEDLQRQRDVQRRQYEEQQRREAIARAAEEEQRKRAETPSRGARGTRGKPRGTSRAGSVSGSNTSAYGQRTAGRGSSTTSSTSGLGRTNSVSRAGTGIGRGLRSRGRG